MNNLRSLATASSAKRWMNCSGSVSLCKDIPDEVKAYATEGTKAHAEASKALIAEQDIDKIPNDEAVKLYVQYVRDICNMCGKGEIFVEPRLSLLGSSGGIDCYFIPANSRTAHLFDFKYGVGVPLYAQENEQLLFYAVAIKESHPEITTVIAHLIQPRVTLYTDDSEEEIPNITSWTIPWQRLASQRKKIEKALIAVDNSETLKAGSWCQFCKAKGKCPIWVARGEKVKEGTSTIDVPSTGTDEDISLPQVVQNNVPIEATRIVEVLKYKKSILSWFEKAEAYLLQQLLLGIDIPGIRIGAKRSYREWRDDIPEEEIAEKLYKLGVENAWNKKLIGITKAEKEAQGSIDELTKKEPGGPAVKFD